MRTEWACIELTKTRGWEARDDPEEKLPDYAALVAWAEARSLVDGTVAARLRARAAASLSEAAVALRRAHEIRGRLYAVLRTTAAGGTPSSSEMAWLNQVLVEAASRRVLAAGGDGVVWTWSDDDALERPLWPVIWSAGELLTSPERRRLKQCAADDCGWLFIDASRNRSRRWCDMSECGNRAKARRFRRRHPDGNVTGDASPEPG
ncbi:MAG: CGNR zinc finger domain-containing protein [Gemmatimonadota bacterium]